MDTKKPIDILIVDNHQMMLEGLRVLIERHPEMRVAGEACDGQEAVALAEQLVPDVIIMDINIPCIDGIEATRRIVQARPQAKVIALSMYANKQFIAAMFKAGACGYVLKQMAFEELIKAIRTVLEDKTYLCPSLTDMVVEDYKNHLANMGRVDSIDLTEIEREILCLLADGHSSKEIALQTSKSPKTIDAYRRQIMRKLQVDNLADLIKYAIRTGLISLDD
jgi:two-component system, NarL family, response regulator NreC